MDYLCKYAMYTAERDKKYHSYATFHQLHRQANFLKNLYTFFFIGIQLISDMSNAIKMSTSSSSHEVLKENFDTLCGNSQQTGKAVLYERRSFFEPCDEYTRDNE